MSIYSEPRSGLQLSDCDFYHVMDLPEVGTTTGQWDLRTGFDDYLGHFDFAGKRVLEIGPASGFLTFEMESRGASVVAVEIEDSPGWDFVPYPDQILEPYLTRRREHMRRLKNSWWFVHGLRKSSAKMFYGDAYALPDALGRFDVAVLAAVLLHCNSPVQILAQCAKRAEAIIIVDMLTQEIEGSAACHLVPTATNRRWDTWWRFSSEFFRQFLDVMGYSNCETTFHTQKYFEKSCLCSQLLGGAEKKARCRRISDRLRGIKGRMFGRLTIPCVATYYRERGKGPDDKAPKRL